jgi:prevent-host-death family protein
MIINDLFQEAKMSEAASTYSVAEAKRHFSELLRRVSQGERLVITSHGRPVAQIAPPEVPDLEERVAAIERILELRKGARAEGLDFKEAASEGRL